jgi:hypothetical protein
VSVILANESREADRPFLVDPFFLDELVVDALRAAAKEITSVNPVGFVRVDLTTVGGEFAP